MIDLLVLAVGVALVFIVGFALNDARAEQRAQHADPPSHVRVLPRPYDWDDDE